MTHGFTRLTAVLTWLLATTAVGFAAGQVPATGPRTVTASSPRPSGSYFPTIYATPEAYTAATGQRIGAFSQSPYIAQMGNLPSVEQRLPREPLVIQPSEGIGRYGGTLRDPHTGNISFLEDMFREFPLNYAPDMGSIIPNIFKDWRVLEGGRVYEFTIREGMKWSDGDPFDAQDFMFWYNGVANNRTLSPGGDAQLRLPGSMAACRPPGPTACVSPSPVRLAFSWTTGPATGRCGTCRSTTCGSSTPTTPTPRG